MNLRFSNFKWKFVLEIISLVALCFIFTFNVFIYYLIWIFLINLKIKINSNYKIFALIHIFFVYIYIFLKYREYNDQTIFWDMQNFLLLTNCNKMSSFEYTFINSNKISECITDLGFGPLSYIITTSLNIQIFTYSIAFFFIIYLAYIINGFLKDDSFIFNTFLLVTPSVIFLFEALNPDIIFAGYLIYKLRNKKSLKNLKIIELLFISLFTQIKIYSVVYLVSIIILRFLKKEPIKIYMLFASINIYMLFEHYFINGNSTPTVSSVNRTFGLLSDYIIINDTAGNNFFIIYLISILVISMFLKNYLFINKKFENKISNENTAIVFPMLFVIMFFANYGYKFIFVVIYFLYIHKREPVLIHNFFIISLTTTPLLSFFGFDFDGSLYNILFFGLNRVSILFLLIYLLTTYIKLISIFYMEYKEKVS